MIEKESFEKEQLEYFTNIEKMFIECTVRELKK